MKLAKFVEQTLNGFRFYRNFSQARRLRQSDQERLRALFQQAPDPTVIVDQNGQITAISTRVTEVLGYQPDDLIGKEIEILVPEDLRARHAKHRSNYSESPHPREMGARINLHAVKKNGSQIPVEISINPFRVGSETSFITSIRDVSARKAVERRYRETVYRFVDDLMRSNQDLKKFTSVVSHDLRDPLATIASSLSLVLEGPSLDKEAREFVVHAQASVQRLSDRISSLLNLSEAHSGAAAKSVDCNQVMKELLEDLRSQIRAASAHISWEPLPVVQVYPSIIELVLQNLVSNAIKYRGPLPPMIRVSATAHKDCWVFSVQDNGRGIAAANLPHLFEAGYRESHDVSVSGYGIGLDTCKRILERIGQRIWVESEPEKGSTFYFTMPLLGI